MLRVTPVDRLQQIAHLRRGQRYHAIYSLRPHELPAIQPFGVERQAEPVMPDRLDQRAASAAEHKYITSKRIPAKPLLYL